MTVSRSPVSTTRRLRTIGVLPVAFTATGFIATVFAATLFIATLFAVTVFAGAAPAWAHDQLVASDPVDGAQLASSPAAITLTFNEPPLNVDPQIVVTDATDPTGASAVPGTPTVAGNAVTLTVPAPLPGGDYRVAWRVVSGDGHPVEGALSFAVVAPAPTAPQGAGPSSAGTGADASAPGNGADASAGHAASSAPSPPAATSTPPAAGAGQAPKTSPIVFAGIACLIAAAAFTALTAIRRRRIAAGPDPVRSGDDPR